jgi:hypothetical protein
MWDIEKYEYSCYYSVVHEFDFGAIDNYVHNVRLYWAMTNTDLADLRVW